ncbi:glutathione S-transferase family protein [Telmatospirillum sp. J64-1]|uniref:glutathione S-transferase family protein n=1 Tax=Telmatospirillum sp. J64-1 TaxID=2502183 RepID=UPI00115CE7B7|nr:glutathione S-transferase N-terminal domain-containing protein [Telmatospirillum sp. J64-1]
MKLFVNKTSPYARKVLVLLQEKGEAGARVAVVQTDPWASPEDLLAVNPASKVPSLETDDGWSLGESWAIAEYLDAVLPGPRLLPAEGEARWRELRLAAMAQALTDAAFDAAIESRRPEGERSPGWVARQMAAAVRMIAALESEAEILAGGFGLGALSVGAALDYVAFRHADLQWRETAPRLAAWHAEIIRRPSFQATDPRA